MKYNKSAGYDDINYNVAKNRFGEFCDPILLIFNLSSSNKQFRFQAGHSTDQVIIPLLDQIYENFEGNKYTPGVFIELSSKAFDFVDHKILLSKLEIYGIKWNMFKKFESYLINRISQWFISNKLSINMTKTKYSFFFTNQAKEIIFPLLSQNYT